MNPPDTDLRRLAQEASGLLTTAVETAEVGGLLTPAWVAAAEAAADELERHYTLAACGHPAACLRDGACGWCADVRDARLALEARDAAREASASDLERRREVEARADATDAALRWYEARHGTRAEQEAADAEDEALWGRIEAMSDEDLDAALVEEGGDPGAIAERGRDGARWAIEHALRYHDLRKERDELRLTLLAEQGNLAGAPSEGWGWTGSTWWKLGVSRDVVAAYVQRYVTEGGRVGWTWVVAGCGQGNAPTAREAMKAAGKAAEGEQG